MSAAAARQSQQKKVLVGGAAVLACLLAVQGPRTMKMLGGSTASADAADPPASPVDAADDAAAAPAGSIGLLLAALGVSEPVPTPEPGQLASFLRYEFKDPFRALVTSSAASPATAAPSPAPAPAVSPAAPETKPAPATQSASHWTIVLDSIPTVEGTGRAKTRAGVYRAAGLPRVAVLTSSRYSSLRAGYYVVHSGSYATKAAAYRALPQARLHSPTAYPRHLR